MNFTELKYKIMFSKWFRYGFLITFFAIVGISTFMGLFTLIHVVYPLAINDTPMKIIYLLLLCIPILFMNGATGCAVKFLCPSGGYQQKKRTLQYLGAASIIYPLIAFGVFKWWVAIIFIVGCFAIGALFTMLVFRVGDSKRKKYMLEEFKYYEWIIKYSTIIVVAHAFIVVAFVITFWGK